MATKRAADTTVSALRAPGRWRTLFGLLDKTMVTIGIIFFAGFALFPLVYMVSSSFKTLTEILSGFPSILPQHPTLDNYHYVLFGNELVQINYPLNVRNSLEIAVMTVLLVMAVALPAALSLARYHFWWTTLLSGWVRVAQVVGGIIVIIPLYVVLRDLHLVNTLFGVSVAQAIPGSAFSAWVLASFIRQIPTDLDDAASIDGAGSLQILRHVIIPLASPGIVSVVILVFLLSWNDFLNPLVLLSDPTSYTITIGLNTYVDMGGQTEWGRLLTAGVLSCIPPVLLLIFAERYIVRGMAAGALKD